MEAHSGTRDDLFYLLSKFGIESASIGWSTVNYNQVLSLMTQHLMNNNINAAPGSVTRVLLEAVASAMAHK